MATRITRVRDIVEATPWSAVVRLDLGTSPFRFKAGQAARLGHPPGAAKAYSIASSPELERQAHAVEFLIGTKPGGSFGPHLAGLAVGAAVSLKGPSGVFGLPEPLRERRLLFIAGGTGIAPMRSMIHSVLSARNPPAITLLYSAQSRDGFAFVQEFRRLSRAGRLRLSLTATREPGATWKGRRGRIQAPWLRQLLRDGPTFCFVCGPPGFVKDVSAKLKRLGVPPTRIRQEGH